MQFEITPFNVMYESLIINPYLNSSNMVHDLVDCATSGVEHEVQASNASNSWLASLKLPWSLIGNLTGPDTAAAPAVWSRPSVAAEGPVAPVWRFNLMRVLMLHDVDFCTQDVCEYGAFSPTFQYPPAFHYPEFFAVMVLA